MESEETVSVSASALAQRALDLALEVGEYDELHVPDACDDWSLKEMEVSSVDADGSMVVVEGEVQGTVSEKVRSATRNPPGAAHPAEYTSHDVPIAIRIEWDLSEFACSGEVIISAEALEYPTAEPEPDIDAHRYDGL